MKTYSFIIVDDNNLDRIFLNLHLKKYPFLVHLGSFSSGQAALDFLKNKQVDLMFCDIRMPDIDGLTLLETIRSKVTCPILISAYNSYALDGFKLKALDYLTKPIRVEALNETVLYAKNFLDANNKAKLFDLNIQQVGAIDISDILYMEAMKDYTKIIYLNKTSTTIHGNLASILRSEPYHTLLRIHKSYAVQRVYIKSIKYNQIVLIDGSSLPLGRIYRQSIVDDIDTNSIT